MLRQKQGDVLVRAVVAFPTREDAAGLDAQLDDSFGAGGWRFSDFNACAAALDKLAEDGGAFFVVGLREADPHDIRGAAALIERAKGAGLSVVLLAEALTPAAMHELMRAGADDFAPLPLPASVLTETVQRLAAAPTAGGPQKAPKRRGLVFPVYGAAGGVGASTLVTNLAWEAAKDGAKADRRVALLDFNFQYGSVATYLDLPRREAIYELLSDTSTMDEEGFGQALTTYGDRMDVLTAPMDALPLDIIGPDDVRSLIDLARVSYDLIFIDLPQTLAHWSDLVLTEAEQFFAVMESDMRSAQNMLRFLRAVQAEDLAVEKISVCLNRAPSFTDLSGKSRSRRLEESLGVKFAYRLPDGGKQVREACDQGAPLERAARGNATRKEIRKIAGDILRRADPAAAVGRKGGAF